MPYSYSRIQTYKQCPAKFNYSYNMGLPRGESGSAALRGLEMHGAIEDLLLGERDDLPLEIFGYLGFFEQLREMEATPEVRWAVNWDWEPCEWDGDDCMLRGLVDIRLQWGENVALYELKTGKIYEEHGHQTMMYGAVELALNSDLESVEVMLIYLDQQHNKSITYHRMMLPDYKAFINKDIMDIEMDDIYLSKPSFMCRWCDFSKAKGGPCVC